MLAIRIAAITLASDSAITLARFRPSKVRNRILSINMPVPFACARSMATILHYKSSWELPVRNLEKAAAVSIGVLVGV